MSSRYTYDEVMAMDEDALADAVMARLCFSTVNAPGGVVLNLSESAKDIRVAYALEVLIPEDKRHMFFATLINMRGYNAWDIIHASPADRCRAWLMV